MTRLSESRRSLTANHFLSAEDASGSARNKAAGVGGVDPTLRASVVDCIAKALATHRSMPMAPEDPAHYKDAGDLVGRHHHPMWDGVSHIFVVEWCLWAHRLIWGMISSAQE